MYVYALHACLPTELNTIHNVYTCICTYTNVSIYMYVLCCSALVSHLALLGSTVRKTLPYLSRALTHRHMDLQAFEVFSTMSGTNFGFSMYFLSFLIVASEMLSWREEGREGLSNKRREERRDGGREMEGRSIAR